MYLKFNEFQQVLDEADALFYNHRQDVFLIMKLIDAANKKFKIDTVSSYRKRKN